jgi:hypothetical protein
MHTDDIKTGERHFLREEHGGNLVTVHVDVRGVWDSNLIRGVFLSGSCRATSGRNGSGFQEIILHDVSPAVHSNRRHST